MTLLRLLAVAGSAIALVWLGLHLALRTKPLTTTRIIGHRGAAGLAPENTLAAISAGMVQGVQAIEIDVRRSQDGVLVVMHDSFVGRTTDGTGQIENMTWDELSQLDAGSHFSSVFAGERIPRLEDVLDVLRQNGTALYLEVKAPDRYPGIEAQIIDALAEHEMAQHTVVMSFDHGWLARFHDLAPDTPVISLGVWVAQPPLGGAEQAVGVQWRNVVLDPTLVWRMHRRGIEVSVWTVNQAWQMRLMQWLGVDAITTDYPDVAASLTP